LVARRAKAACDDLHEAIILVDCEAVMSKRPSKPELIVDIDLPRPPDVIDVQADPAFGACFKQHWSARNAHR
jgi:NitT/TauT family transport system ATP-binding protein